MNRFRSLALGSAILALLLSPPVRAQADRPDDETMKIIQDGSEQADKDFNAADARALAETFAEDGDLVLSLGEAARGRAAIERAFEKLFAENKGARIRQEVVSARLIKPDVLLVDAAYELSGTPRPSKGRVFLVRVNRGGKWQTVSHRTSAAPRER